MSRIDKPNIHDDSFVVTDEPQKTKRDEVRRMVRANAMRDYWRRKKKATRTSSAQSSRKECADLDRPQALANDLNVEQFDGASTWTNGQLQANAGFDTPAVRFLNNTFEDVIVNTDANHFSIYDDQDNAKVIPETLPIWSASTKSRGFGADSMQMSLGPASGIGGGCSIIDPFDTLPLEGSRHNDIVLSHSKLTHLSCIYELRTRCGHAY